MAITHHLRLPTFTMRNEINYDSREILKYSTMMSVPKEITGHNKVAALFLLLCSCLCHRAYGQFGVPRATQSDTAAVDVNGNALQPLQPTDDFDDKLVAKLVSSMPDLKEQTAVNIATLVKAASTDPETVLMIQRMKEGSGKEQFSAFVSDIKDMKQVTKALYEVYQELSALEVLFQDPARDYNEMKREGMIPKDKEKLYEKDPLPGGLMEGFNRLWNWARNRFGGGGGNAPEATSVPAE